jgi:ADP-heptose:LPS heptosyltransferase
MPDARKVILKNHLSPGDVLAMSAAVYSLHRQHPGHYRVAVDTTANEFYEHSPDVERLDRAQVEGWEQVEFHYDAVNACNQRGIHFLQGCCEFFEHAWGVRVPLLTNRPLIYLSDAEKSWLPQVQEITGKPTKYFVLCGGRKGCFTSKHWGAANYQRVVDILRGKVLFVQVGEKGHHHPPLQNVINLVGKTDLRQLVRLCYHAEGGLGGVTLLMHLMAALEKPYVCLMGGREPVQWNSYPRQQLLHTVGMLPCCRDGGCWRSRTVKLGDGDEKDNSLCENPMPCGEEYVPKCLMMLPPERVAESILQFSS